MSHDRQLCTDRKMKNYKKNVSGKMSLIRYDTKICDIPQNKLQYLTDNVVGWTCRTFTEDFIFFGKNICIRGVN